MKNTPSEILKVNRNTHAHRDTVCVCQRRVHAQAEYSSSTIPHQIGFIMHIYGSIDTSESNKSSPTLISLGFVP